MEEKLVLFINSQLVVLDSKHSSSFCVEEVITVMCAEREMRVGYKGTGREENNEKVLYQKQNAKEVL